MNRILALALLIALAIPALAAEPATKKSAPTAPAAKKDEPAPPKAAAALPPKRFGDWELVCETSGDPAKERCLAVQTQTIKENNARLIQVNLGKLGPQGEAVFMALVPLGIWLPSGVALKIDELPQIPLTVTQCTNDGCAARVQLTDRSLQAMLDAKTLSVGMVPSGTNQTLVINLSVKGLKPAWSEAR